MTGACHRASAWALISGVCLLAASCGGGGGTSPTQIAPATYLLTVNSTSPASGVAITVSPTDSNGTGSGSTSFTRTYASGTTVTLTAPATAGGNKFSSWSGCTTTSTVTCTATLTAAMTVTAAYTAPPSNGVTSVVVTPNPATATIGSQVQFTATVAGNGTFSNGVTWSVAAPSGSSLSAGTISGSGLYTTPYPAPATVTVTATSTQDATKSGSVTVSLASPTPSAGPAISVDAGNQLHAINPFIYGLNAYALTQTTAQEVNLSVDRWGGDDTSRYNYKIDATNSGGDWFFENGVKGSGQQETGAFNSQVASDAALGAKTMGTVPLTGWVAKDTSSCGFPASTYPNQLAFASNNGNCGDGQNPDKTNITGNDPTVTSIPAGPSWAGDWVTYLAGKFGTAAKGGVAIYSLDNEPIWWNGTHRDVHPLPFTYDEVTNNGIATALAIKNADGTAAVSGPVMDNWWAYFYSAKDMWAGWAQGPCYQQWDNPVDRTAHNGAPLLEYYLQQFKAAEAQHGKRLLDYLDIHAYLAASYNGNGVGNTTAGDTGEQQARLNSTRVFWDPTYTDPNLPQPNYITDANYTSSCSVPLAAPQVIRRMHNWVDADYPGTKTAITEYNWGGQENINGAVTQADILGIFGREGLDLATLWGPPDASSQAPGVNAFKIYRNYDGANSQFGDTALNSTSADQSKLSVYGAVRSKDGMVTVVVINKTYGDLSATLSLDNLTPNGNAKVFLYSAANLSAIVAQPDLNVTPPAQGSTSSALSATFPAQSITLLVVPKM